MWLYCSLTGSEITSLLFKEQKQKRSQNWISGTDMAILKGWIFNLLYPTSYICVCVYVIWERLENKKSCSLCLLSTKKWLATKKIILFYSFCLCLHLPFLLNLLYMSLLQTMLQTITLIFWPNTYKNLCSHWFHFLSFLFPFGHMVWVSCARM